MRGAVVLSIALVLVPSRAAWAHPPWGLAEDSDGNLYFSDLTRIWQRSSSGEHRIFVDDVHTHALYVTADGALVGQDEGHDGSTVWWRMPSGGERTPIDAVAAARQAGWTDAEGTVYLPRNDQQGSWIEAHAPDGTRRVIAGGSFGSSDGQGSAARFGLQGSAALAPGRDALLVTSGGHLRRVGFDGTVETLLGDDEGFAASNQDNGQPRYSALLGVAAAPSGDIWVADIDRRAVFRRRPSGDVAVVYRAPSGRVPVGVKVRGETLLIVEAPADASDLAKHPDRGGVRIVEHRGDSKPLAVNKRQTCASCDMGGEGSEGGAWLVLLIGLGLWRGLVGAAGGGVARGS